MTAGTDTRNRAPRPTDKMVGFMCRLAAERVAPSLGATAAERLDAMTAWLKTDAADKWECMRRIDWLKAQPKDVRSPDDARADTDADLSVLTRGVYERNGEVYVVKKSRQSERLYANRVVEIRGERLTEADETVNFELEYAKGVIYRLRPQDKMTKARAEEFLIRYSRCIVCGRTLKKADSVARGIGPVCITYFA
jgi:hypothetical protein